MPLRTPTSAPQRGATRSAPLSVMVQPRSGGDTQSTTPAPETTKLDPSAGRTKAICTALKTYGAQGHHQDQGLRAPTARRRRRHPGGRKEAAASSSSSPDNPTCPITPTPRSGLATTTRPLLHVPKPPPRTSTSGQQLCAWLDNNPALNRKPDPGPPTANVPASIPRRRQLAPAGCPVITRAPGDGAPRPRAALQRWSAAARPPGRLPRSARLSRANLPAR